MEDTYKIYYNEEGWVCERYPQDIEIENHDRYIEVGKEDFDKSLGTKNHHAWRVVDGKLVEERYAETPEEELLENLRGLREEICFPVINRGHLWHESLTPEQRKELMTWYQAWLEVTKTKTEPIPPDWLFISKKECDEDDGTNQDSTSCEQAE
jgi:hypothetical protein